MGALVAGSGLAVLAVATASMLRGVEPFATAYYIFAWYGLLLVLDALVAWNGGVLRSAALPAALHDDDIAARERELRRPRDRFLLLGRPAFALGMLGWSAVTWLFFELLNFRLENWYYVFLPDGHAARWATVVVSFATVLPAVFVTEAVLAGQHVAGRVRWPRLRLDAARLRRMQLAGALMLALCLLWPRWFFPLVWGGVVLLLEPINYRREPRRTLLGDLERGEPGRLLRLLVAGALIGLLWELFNIEARAKWIYTVPYFEELKLFEMPVLGFLGFPPFALECFAIWQALVIGGVAPPRFGPPRPAPASARAGAGVAALLFAASVLHGMEQATITSYTPRLARLPAVPSGAAAALEREGYDAFRLASSRAEQVAAVAGAEPDSASAWIEHARLVTLRGIGARNARWLAAAGAPCLEALARAEPDRLARRLEQVTGQRVVPARVRVWVRAAQRALRQEERAPEGAACRGA